MITLWSLKLNLRTDPASLEGATSVFLWWRGEMQFDIMLENTSPGCFIVRCHSYMPAMIRESNKFRARRDVQLKFSHLVTGSLLRLARRSDIVHSSPDTHLPLAYVSRRSGAVCSRIIKVLEKCLSGYLHQYANKVNKNNTALRHRTFSGHRYKDTLWPSLCVMGVCLHCLRF